MTPTLHISNRKLKASIKLKGAELCSLIPSSHGKELIWQGNPTIWSSHAPVLFPIIGKLKNNQVYHEGKSYQTTKHGLVRNNDDLTIIDQTTSSVTLELKSSAETRVLYPFDFAFQIKYHLKDDTLIVHHRVLNPSNKTILFSLGAHPGFNIPLFENDTYEHNFLEFSKPESAHQWLIDSEGLIAGKGPKMFDKSNKLFLTHELFESDALVFKNLNSRSVSLVSKSYGKIIEMSYPDFEYLGIWAKPDGDFVCIEPWMGIADSSDSSQILAEKEGLRSLPPGEVFEASYSISTY